MAEGRRSLKRKSDGDQMSERESRQSSVRARISQDREHHQDEGESLTNHSSSVERKRFSFPGKTKGSQEVYHQPHHFSSSGQKTTKTRATDFEAHLQEVWSVRKNIHHRQQQQQSSSSTGNTGSKTSILQSCGAGGAGGASGGGGGLSLTQADKYSRHGVLPPPEPPLHRKRDIGKDCSTTAAIETVTPWSLRKPSTSFNTKYSDPRHQQPTATVNMTSSPPSGTTATRVKGRGRGGEPARICKEDFEPTVAHKREQSEKVDYAKSMAKGYLRSVGSGAYSPQQHSYVKAPEPQTEKGKTTKWKRTDSDEFDF